MADTSEALQALFTNDISLPPVTIPVYEQVYMHLGWGENNFPVRQIQRIADLRNDIDELKIWDILLSGPKQYRFPGDVLGTLMSISPYPCIHRQMGPRLQVDPALYRTGTFMQHPGSLASYNVDITEDIKIFEKHTDWYEVLGFDPAPSSRFAQLIDQLHLESSKNPGTKGYFASPFKHHKFPVSRVAFLWNHFRDPLACDILQDWGLILRSVESNQGPPSSFGYLQAFMDFLIKRYGYDRLSV